MITHNDYERLAAQGYTHIPLVRELPADLDTPVSVYLKLANDPNSYLLESASEGRYWGRYSIIGTSCQNYVCVNDFTVSLYEDGRLSSKQTVPDPLAWIERLSRYFQNCKGIIVAAFLRWFGRLFRL